ncbi:replication initiation protein, partial [Ruegeria lacuscaerulensis]|uniref:replication initiation protein n=1 Tax=Ruegeria lacuscaerulensis TaxID=55218 RepID=UPI001BE4B9F7
TLRNPPSLRALKLQDVLMKNAGGKICEACWHELDLAVFYKIKGMGHQTHEDLVRLFEELRGATLRHVNTKAGHTAVYGLIAVGRVDFDDAGKVRYKFDDEFRRVMEMSDLYAVLDYRTTLALSSRYSHRLHQMIALRAKRDVNTERFTVENLRARLGVQTGKLQDWSNFRKFALQAAVDEINHVSRFEISFRVTKKERRKTTEVELEWKVKEDLETAKQEQQAHSAGRKARRDGTAETPALAFPASGSIEWSKPWNEIARIHGNGKDKDLIAQDFRIWCQSQGIPLDKAGIEKTFEGFCKRSKV